jgi:hypothetical protein
VQTRKAIQVSAAAVADDDGRHPARASATLTPAAMTEATIAQRRDLIATAAVAVCELPNAAAWRQMQILLAADPTMPPARQRVAAWRVRVALAKRTRRSPGLTKDQLHAAAVEIAATAM